MKYLIIFLLSMPVWGDDMNSATYYDRELTGVNAWGVELKQIAEGIWYDEETGYLVLTGGKTEEDFFKAINPTPDTTLKPSESR